MLRLLVSAGLSAASLLVFLSGCGPATASVKGTVTVDGEPLKSGVISFVPADGAGAPATTAISDGAYTLEMAPGKKAVQISAPVVVGQGKAYNAPDAPTFDITEESLPSRYNTQTELIFEAAPGSNSKDWNVESKAAFQR